METYEGMNKYDKAWSTFVTCLVAVMIYGVLSIFFFFVTILILVFIDRITPDSPYDMREYVGIGYGFIALGLSVFLLAPLTMIGIYWYDAYRQRKRQKEKRKNNSPANV